MITKINAKDVVKMRKLKAAKPELSSAKIGKMFKISQAYAYNILTSKYWKTLPKTSKFASQLRAA